MRRGARAGHIARGGRVRGHRFLQGYDRPAPGVVSGRRRPAFVALSVGRDREQKTPHRGKGAAGKTDGLVWWSIAKRCAWRAGRATGSPLLLAIAPVALARPSQLAPLVPLGPILRTSSLLSGVSRRSGMYSVEPLGSSRISAVHGSRQCMSRSGRRPLESPRLACGLRRRPRRRARGLVGVHRRHQRLPGRAARRGHRQQRRACDGDYGQRVGGAPERPSEGLAAPERARKSRAQRQESRSRVGLL